MNTMSGAIIMGRKTWDSLPKKPLPNRLNIVLSRSPQESEPNVKWCTSIIDAVKIASHAVNNIYFIGGQEIFSQCISYIDMVILTRVHTHVQARSAKYIILPDKRRLIWSSGKKVYKKLTYTFELWSI
jgi:dihydrofolate reductase